MLKTVPWDGPDPQPGDYLAQRRGEAPLLVRAVTPNRHSPDARLVLDVAKTRPAQVPDHAVIHPRSRYAASDPAGPPRARQLAADGETAVVASRWRDPDDVRPTAARRAREIVGYRGYCPLRRMAEQKGSQISERHIIAADHLRGLYDLARLGATGGQDLLAVHTAFGPRAGPAAPATLQAQASAQFAAAFARFAPAQHPLLAAVVLTNHSLYRWCGEEAARRGLAKPLDPKVEMGKLVALLDILVAHFREAVDAAVFHAVTV
jgi:hypothetical protein